MRCINNFYLIKIHLKVRGQPELPYLSSIFISAKFHFYFLTLASSASFLIFSAIHDALHLDQNKFLFVLNYVLKTLLYRTPHICAMQQDYSEDLQAVGSTLYDVAGVYFCTFSASLKFSFCNVKLN